MKDGIRHRKADVSSALSILLLSEERSSPIFQEIGLILFLYVFPLTFFLVNKGIVSLQRESMHLSQHVTDFANGSHVSFCGFSHHNDKGICTSCKWPNLVQIVSQQVGLT